MSLQPPAALVPSPLSSGCATYWPGSTSSPSQQTNGNPDRSTARREGRERMYGGRDGVRRGNKERDVLEMENGEKDRRVGKGKEKKHYLVILEWNE